MPQASFCESRQTVQTLASALSIRLSRPSTRAPQLPLRAFDLLAHVHLSVASQPLSEVWVTRQWNNPRLPQLRPITPTRAMRLTLRRVVRASHRKPPRLLRSTLILIKLPGSSNGSFPRFIESQLRLEADAREILPYVRLHNASHLSEKPC